jgi:hypothetical protein
MYLTDEPVGQSHARTGNDRARSNRGMLGLVGVIIVIVVVALMLLLFRGCDTSAGRAGGTSGNKEIVPVNGLTADPGVVSAWVAPGSDINSVLRVAGLEDSTITDMGGGRYVISVPPGTEDTVVRILVELKGVYDAGRVYGPNR